MTPADLIALLARGKCHGDKAAEAVHAYGAAPPTDCDECDTCRTREEAIALVERKPGDEVAIVRHRRTPEIATVDRVTKTQVIVCRQRFNRETGRVIPYRSWLHDPRIEPATDAHRHEKEHMELQRVLLRAARWDTAEKLRLTTLRTIAEALRADPAVGGDHD